MKRTKDILMEEVQIPRDVTQTFIETQLEHAQWSQSQKG